MPGTLITRNCKGETVQVKVVLDGFEFEGERFKSLSAVAKRVTGTVQLGYVESPQLSRYLVKTIAKNS